MGYKHRNPQNRMRAAAMLRQLKGQLVDVTGVKVEAFSDTAASAEAYWQLSKASGVHVYQEGGGWHADLEFSDLPQGIPTIIGTPEPLPTRAEAIESVVDMMSICAQRDAVPAPDPSTGLRYFRFDDHEVPVHPALLAEDVGRTRTLGIDLAEIIADLEAVRIEIAGDGPVTQAAWEAASFENRYEACNLCCIAMALGVRQLTFDPTLSAERDAGPMPAMH